MLFHFKNFSLSHGKSALKIGTDAVLLAAVIPLKNQTRLLDIGTGCGVIAFCLADRLRSSQTVPVQITGIDIDEKSIEESQENLLNFPETNTISIIFKKQHLQNLAENPTQSFDLIVTNPPFFGSSLKPENSAREISKHRDNNLSFKDLIASIVKLLDHDGEFYLILPPAEFSEFEKLAQDKLFLHYYCQIIPKINKPHNRVIAGYKKSPVDPIDRQVIVIRNEDSGYTDDYCERTRKLYP